MPRLLSNTSRFALEEAVPSPTDVSSQNPGITKQKFNVPVRIESNDMLVTIRSDHLDFINDVVAWLKGSNVLKNVSIRSPAFNGLFNFTSQRVQFTQRGMPRAVADSHNLPYNARINPNSSMWMGFVDQQTNGGARPLLLPSREIVLPNSQTLWQEIISSMVPSSISRITFKTWHNSMPIGPPLKLVHCPNAQIGPVQRLLCKPDAMLNAES
jgi:hypothetical protein